MDYGDSNGYTSMYSFGRKSHYSFPTDRLNVREKTQKVSIFVPSKGSVESLWTREGKWLDQVCVVELAC